MIVSGLMLKKMAMPCTVSPGSTVYVMTERRKRLGISVSGSAMRVMLPSSDARHN
jgi:hypothetical protein